MRRFHHSRFEMCSITQEHNPTVEHLYKLSMNLTFLTVQLSENVLKKKCHNKLTKQTIYSNLNLYVYVYVCLYWCVNDQL